MTSTINDGIYINHLQFYLQEQRCKKLLKIRFLANLTLGDADNKMIFLRGPIGTGDRA
jgi:hypothetical protein